MGTDGPGPHLSLHQAPCPAEAWGRRPDHPTRHEKDQVLRQMGQPLLPGASSLPLTHASEDAWGAGLHTPNSGLWGWGRVRPGAQSAGFWPRGYREHQNPVDWGAGGGEGRGAQPVGARELKVVQKHKQACGRERGPLWRSGGPSSLTPACTPQSPARRPCLCLQGWVVWGADPDAKAGPCESRPPVCLRVLGQPRALNWAQDTPCVRRAFPLTSRSGSVGFPAAGRGRWSSRRRSAAGRGEGGGKGRGQTFGFYKVKEIYFLRS